MLRALREMRAVALSVALLIAGTATDAFAAPTGGCTEATFGMPCDPGDGNACGGVCQPDFAQTGEPMSCLPVDADILGRLKLTNLDGIDCSPGDAPGADCAHTCSAGQCVAKNAPSGAACLPAGDGDSGSARGSDTVCAGACDGNGACAPRTGTHCDKYGRDELGICLYTACNPAQNTGYCEQFESPAGVSCSTQTACVTGETCGANGCGGGTHVSGCTPPPGGDASSGAGDDGSSPASPSPSSHGCSFAGTAGGGTTVAIAGTLVVLMSKRRRRRA